jgi:bacillolysin
VYGGDDVDTVYDLIGSIHNYYVTKFDRNGANNQGGLGTGQQDGATVYTTDQTRANTYQDVSWACPDARFSNGAIAFCHDMATPDVVGHEYSHGIAYFVFNPNVFSGSVPYTSGMVYESESGALDEDFSDVMGEAIERFVTGSTDWVNATGVVSESGGLPRSLIDPPSHVFPWGHYSDKLQSPWTYCGSDDHGGVHYNSTIPSKAFYLMSEGETFNGCTIRGLGLDKVEQILYRTMTTYYTPSETFNAAHIAIQRAAADLYPDADCWQVKKALQAVELDQPSPCSGATERTPYAATPFTAGDIGQALSIAAGIVAAAPADIGRLDVALTGDSFLKVGMRDAIGVARMVAGIDM